MSFRATVFVVSVFVSAVATRLPSQETSVTVELTNGQLIRGVVESMDREPTEPLTVLRPGGAAGTLILPAARVVAVRKANDPSKSDPLTDRERKEISRAWRAYRAKEREAYFERRRKERREERIEALVRTLEDGEQTSAALGDEVAESRYRDLITRFHPNDGFTPGLRAVLDWRQWTLDVLPSPQEQAWLDVYQEWLVAWKWWLSQAAPSVPAAPRT